MYTTVLKVGSTQNMVLTISISVAYDTYSQVAWAINVAALSKIPSRHLCEYL